MPLHPDRGHAVDLLAPLRAVGHGGLAHADPDAPHPDLPVALSDESSARIASEMCGSVMKTQPSYTFTETTGRPEFSLLSGRAGGGRGTIGASKSFRQAREPVFTPRDFSLLANYQAICLPYDGTKSLPARRVYLKPHYLPRERGYWRLREEGRI